MTLATAIRKDPKAIRRIVCATVVNEQSLPFDMQVIDTPEKCVEFWRVIIATQPDHEPDKENLVVVLVNTRLQPMAWHRVSLGTLSECNAHPREILRPVIASAAHGFVLMHNHPSHDPSPSQGDEQVTRRMVEASGIMQVRFLDHVVIGRPAPGRSGYYSFREAGLIP